MHQLPQLPYSYDALEPHLDARTMEIHHSKHHQTYVNKLNEALEKHPELQNKSLTELLKSLDSVPEEIRTAVRNNGGGHFSHSLYWEIMSPDQEKNKIENYARISEAINKSFGNFENFKKEFSTKAASVFGSGWTWLVLPAHQSLGDGGSNAEGLVRDEKTDLKIITTQGHDNPVMTNENPLLVIDVWEHAYYLKFQNRRAEFIEAWWNVVNWNKVEENYTTSL